MSCYKSHFGMIVNAIVVWIMVVITTIASLIITNTPFTWVSLMKTGGATMLLVTFITTVIPIGKLGDGSAAKLGLKRGKLAFTLVAGIIPTIIINTGMSSVMPALAIFYNEAIPAAARMGVWVDAFLLNWPIMFVVAYVASIVAGKVGEMVAIKTLGAPPAGPANVEKN